MVIAPNAWLFDMYLSSRSLSWLVMVYLCPKLSRMYFTFHGVFILNFWFHRWTREVTSRILNSSSIPWFGIQHYLDIFNIPYSFNFQLYFHMARREVAWHVSKFKLRMTSVFRNLSGTSFSFYVPLIPIFDSTHSGCGYADSWCISSGSIRTTFIMCQYQKILTI